MATTVDQAEFVFAKAHAQRSATLVQVGALAGTALCVFLAALLQAPINQKRKDLQLVLQSNIYSELPPKYAWVSAAGGTFRGLAADILWMRAEKLKEEGKYYELHQLAKWICTLQPRFATVWSFQAWNMSYNISVATHSTRERWQWVYNGIRLLRDEGIPNNEKSVKLYHQLAWTWFHKVGERLDDYQLKYKRIWATTMEVLLGTPPAGASDQEQVDYFKPVADAPLSLDALLAAHPQTAVLIAQLSSLGVDVEAETKPVNIFHPLEDTFFRPYTAWGIEKKFARFRKSGIEMDEKTVRFNAFFDSTPEAELAPLIAYLRAKVLREQYKMDPKFMYGMCSKLGLDRQLPIDWRTPWSQAMYWGMYGTEKGRQVKNLDEFDLLNTDRIVLFSLGQIARQGDYAFRPNLEKPEESYLNVRPDWRYVEAVHQTALALGKRYPEEGEVVGNTAGESFRDYHINTLHSLLLSLYFAGHREQAERYYVYLAANYKDRYTGETNRLYQGTFNEFLQQQIKDMAGSYHEASMLINALLHDAYMELGSGRGDAYAQRVKEAHDVYESYQKDKDDDVEARRGLPPWAQMQADVLGGFIVNPEIDVLLRFVVWDRVTNFEVKQRCYDDVRAALEEIYSRTDLDIDKTFPPPPGMEQWRKANVVDSPEELARKAMEAKKKQEAEGRK